jgi:hypothetical protein
VKCKRLDSTLYVPGVPLDEYVVLGRTTLRIAMGEPVSDDTRRNLLDRFREIDRGIVDPPGALKFQSYPLAYLMFAATRDTAFGRMAQEWQGARMIELDAARALAAGDSARARIIARDFPSPDSVRNSPLGLAGLRTATRAEVLAQRGDLRGAVGNYESLDPYRFNFSTIEPGFTVYVRTLAARGRLFEQLGEPDKARAAYEAYLARWTIDDPVTASERAAVRAALSRLRDAPR